MLQGCVMDGRQGGTLPCQGLWRAAVSLNESACLVWEHDQTGYRKRSTSCPHPSLSYPAASAHHSPLMTIDGHSHLPGHKNLTPENVIPPLKELIYQIQNTGHVRFVPKAAFQQVHFCKLRISEMGNLARSSEVWEVRSGSRAFRVE